MTYSVLTYETEIYQLRCYHEIKMWNFITPIYGDKRESTKIFDPRNVSKNLSETKNYVPQHLT